MGHYEPMQSKINGMRSQSKRNQLEANHMEALQSDKKKWKRYYAISTDWISRWLAYVEGDSENAVDHPGPINNDSIMEYMSELRHDHSSRN